MSSIDKEMMKVYKRQYYLKNKEKINVLTADKNEPESNRVEARNPNMIE